MHVTNYQPTEDIMDKSGFFAKLFELSFSEFITLQIIKYLYIIGIAFAGFTALGSLFTGFAVIKDDFGKGIFGILFSPLLFIFITLMVRLALEAIVATFRIAENTTKLVEQGRH
jgi:hypothetical protein